MPRVKTPLKILYLDIETAPTNCFTWSLYPKYLSPKDVVEPGYTLCWSAMWEGEREIKYSSIERDGKQKMLEEVHILLDEADAVVHYNGTKFDIPVLNREFVQAGLAPPSYYYQIDLIKTVRKQFKFLSNRLDFVCEQLGLGSKQEHKGISLWYDCMAGEDAAWKLMERYNKQDVRLTKKLYKRILPWIHNHPTVGLWIQDPKNPICPNCGSQKLHKKGTQHNTKSASYDRYTCQSCGTPARSRLQSKSTNANVLVRSQ